MVPCPRRSESHPARYSTQRAKHAPTDHGLPTPGPGCPAGALPGESLSPRPEARSIPRYFAPYPTRKGFRRDSLKLGESEEFLKDGMTLGGTLLQSVQISMKGLGTRVLLQQTNQSQNHRHRIIDFMGHPGEDLAYRDQLLRLPVLPIQIFTGLCLALPAPRTSRMPPQKPDSVQTESVYSTSHALVQGGSSRTVNRVDMPVRHSVSNPFRPFFQSRFSPVLDPPGDGLIQRNGGFLSPGQEFNRQECYLEEFHHYEPRSRSMEPTSTRMHPWNPSRSATRLPTADGAPIMLENAGRVLPGRKGPGRFVNRMETREIPCAFGHIPMRKEDQKTA